jgi:hypothetical protein
MVLDGFSWKVRDRLVIGRSRFESLLGLQNSRSKGIKQDEHIQLGQAVAT